MRPTDGIDATLASALASPEVDALVRPIALKAWRAASGRWHMHTVYHFVGCPGLTAAVYLFVRRTATGQRVMLGVGYTENEAASVNLAVLRQRGALLNATEVHVRYVDGDVSECAQIAFDLEAAVLPRTSLAASHS